MSQALDENSDRIKWARIWYIRRGHWEKSWSQCQTVFSIYLLDPRNRSPMPTRKPSCPLPYSLGSDSKKLNKRYDE